MRAPKAALVSVLSLMASLMVVPAGAAPAGNGFDLAVTVTGPSRTPARGTSFPVSITIRNAGSAPAPQAALGSYVSEALRRDSFSSSNPGMACAESEHHELRCQIPPLAAGQAVTLDLTFTRVMARETWVEAWVSTAEPEGNFENNYGGIHIEADRSNPADVGVSMRFPEQPDPDSSFDYVSKVINYGPQRARDVRFSQSLSERVRFVSVTSSDPNDACTLHEEVYDEEALEGGPYYHREVRCELGDMAFATQRVITVTVIRTDPHELWSSGWVSTSSFDNNYDNDWVDASHHGHPSVTSDLAVSLQRSKDFAFVGEDFEYSLTVTNIGPVAAPNVLVDTWLPQELSLRSVVPADGGEPCEQNEYQSISCKVATLAPGASASFTLAVTRVRGREYWMGASAWSDNYDPDFENSYVEDQMRADKSTPADVGVTMRSPKDPPVGSDYDYQVTVTNHGPSPAGDVSLTVGIPEGADYVSATSSDPTDSCTLFEESYDGAEMKREAGEGGSSEGGAIAPWVYRELRCDLGTMAPGETANVTLTVTRRTEYEMWNSAWIDSSTYDANYDNDYASWGSAGKRRPGCGIADSTEGGSMVICDELAGGTGGGPSSGKEGSAGSRSSRRKVFGGGAGDDTLLLRLSGNPKRHRKIVLKGGRGSDRIKVSVAPGTGNVTVILRGGRGRDTLIVDAPVPGKRFKMRLFGGPGQDTCESLRGGRFTKRAC